MVSGLWVWANIKILCDFGILGSWVAGRCGFGRGFGGEADLLEFAGTEDEVARRDFVAERLADLCRIGGLVF